ncbi:Mitochondrial presequence protease [Endocarpon pusillum Z07020]|uniref:Presequence protease, mitochondrial n=1 Tax=Endocarpon pusillum (strain Z07020 / HMAS-L-300199) TaxID=1263415 RepID=U1HXI6_ENDPU|nr:Mitochondrial presequence protease [Endocarpon pusillum Z07020]ERF74134.1 Mitochondrial presequence protease [Endocarpon pusillum Z07020]
MINHASRFALNTLRPVLKRGRHWKRRPLALRRYASVTNHHNLPKAGEVINGFTLERIQKVPELHLTALQLQHNKTGAQYLHVAREDKNNVFAINFKTNPNDDTGLPHILEHVTLCGSENYPVRDPFFKMVPRSLANFMNAFTSADYTSYPFSTTNKQDYRNLSSVYLDSTLRPLLKKSDFLQEGWRLGPENPRAASSHDDIVFKGVVYNEMKGQMSDASYLYYVRFRDHLFPAIHNSGGDPDKMTELTYEELVEFSRRHYHPSNARFFSYGDLDLSEQLKLVDFTLQGFEKREVDQEVRTPRDLSGGPISVTIPGPLDPMQASGRQSKSSVSWLICETSDILETFSFSILSSLLMSGYGSPLYQGLIQSGMGSNFSPNTGFDSSGRIGTYSLGLDGMTKEDVPRLKHTIHQILHQHASEAFAAHKIEGYMHQLEIALKHKTASFGMGLMDKVLPSWFNGVDPMESLKWNEVVNAFKEKLKQPDYLIGLAHKYLGNDNCLVFTMEPSESFNRDTELREAARRESILSRLEHEAQSSDHALQQLQKQELDLLNEQENMKDANLDRLPSLHVQDISREMVRKPVYTQDLAGSQSIWRTTETNGITYIQAKHELNELPDEFRLLLPLFTESLIRLGTKDRSVGDIEADILRKTGGITISPYIRPDPWNMEKYAEGLTFSSYALDKNVPAMLDLLRTLVCDIDFSSGQAVAAIQELLESKVSGALDSVAEAGHHFAITNASAALSPRGLMQEQLSGLTQIEACAQLLREARARPESLLVVIGKLKTIQRLAISNSSNLSFRVVCESEVATENARLLNAFKSSLPDQQGVGQSPEAVPGSSYSRRTFFDLPFQVSYTGTCLQTVPYASPSKAALTVLGQLLTHNYMHPSIREKGGAYGASASASPVGGLFSMSSYRDPNPRNTLQIIQDAGKFALERDWTARELEEGKLGVFQQIDAPTSVRNDGSKEFMYSITEDMDQKMRERLLDVTRDDIQKAAQQYLVDISADQQAVCILGEKKDWVGNDWDVKHLRMTEG